MLRKKATSSSPKRKNSTDYSDIQERINPVHELELVLAALFYGRAGTGKTTLAASFPGPILHMDIREKGTDSIADVKDLDTISIEDWEEIESVYWYLKSGDSPYKTVIFDAVSQAQDMAVDKAMADDNKKPGEQVTKRQWGTASGLMKNWIINYRDLIDVGINVVFIAHDRASEGEEGEDGELSPSVGPRVMPSVASVLTAGVKIVGQTFIREINEKTAGGKVKRKVEYCMRLGPHAYYETKIRQLKGSYTPDVLADPTYKKLVAIMKGEFEEPETETDDKPVKAKVMRKRSKNQGE